jgi:hypothetical protein
MPLFEDYFEQDSPGAYTTAKAWETLEPADIALKWILFHLR